MDDWFIISPKVSATLNEHVDRLLAKAGLPSDIVQRMPYLITSCEPVRNRLSNHRASGDFPGHVDEIDRSGVDEACWASCKRTSKRR